MDAPIFITGNRHKVIVLERLLGRKLAHQDVELNELQELDIRKVIEHKTMLAYELTKKPVLVEDVALVVHAFGRWPGTNIKLFLQEIGDVGICKMLDGFDNRAATATVIYGLYDGQELRIFEGSVAGSVPQRPQGQGGSGWDAIFIPKGKRHTFAEMTYEADDKELSYQLIRITAVQKLKQFLDIIELADVVAIDKNS